MGVSPGKIMEESEAEAKRVERKRRGPFPQRAQREEHRGRREEKGARGIPHFADSVRNGRGR